MFNQNNDDTTRIRGWILFSWNKIFAPIATGVIRKTGEALIDLPADNENITGIWLFFRAYKKDG